MRNTPSSRGPASSLTWCSAWASHCCSTRSLLGSASKAFFRVLYILPWLFTVAIIAVLWRLLLNPNGVLNYLLQDIGLIDSKVEWLASPSIALFAVTFINIWSGYPFYMMSLLAGLQGIPRDLYEAAHDRRCRSYQALPQRHPAPAAADHRQHRDARHHLHHPAVRPDLDDHRRRPDQRHRDAQHVHLQARVQPLRVLAWRRRAP